jgi:hypothetical protein
VVAARPTNPVAVACAKNVPIPTSTRPTSTAETCGNSSSGTPAPASASAGLDPLYDAIKAMPTVSGMALQRASLANFRRSLALLVTCDSGSDRQEPEAYGRKGSV